MKKLINSFSSDDDEEEELEKSSRLKESGENRPFSFMQGEQKKN